MSDAEEQARVQKADELWRRVREALAPFEVENIDVACLLIRGFQSQLVNMRARVRALEAALRGSIIRLVELNPQNYDDDDVCEVNNSVISTIAYINDALTPTPEQEPR